MSLWLTRPQRDSERMEAALAPLGIDGVIGPVMEIVNHTVSFDGVQKPDALVLTSRRAASTLATTPTAWHDLPVYCVGNATAQAVQRYGFAHTHAGNGSALDLLPLIAAHHRTGAHILHLSGDTVKVELAPLLAVKGIALTRMEVYASQRAASLPPALTHALHVGALTGAVFYSARSVQFAAELAGQTALAPLTAYCLSLDIAAKAGKYGFARILSCPLPTHQAMMELLSQHAMKDA